MTKANGFACRSTDYFFTAARDIGIDMASSWAIGDRYRDVEAANRAGVQAILLNPGMADSRETPEPPVPFFRASDLLDAVRIILSPDGLPVGKPRVDENV